MDLEALLWDTLSEIANDKAALLLKRMETEDKIKKHLSAVSKEMLADLFQEYERKRMVLDIDLGRTHRKLSDVKQARENGNPLGSQDINVDRKYVSNQILCLDHEFGIQHTKYQIGFLKTSDLMPRDVAYDIYNSEQSREVQLNSVLKVILNTNNTHDPLLSKELAIKITTKSADHLLPKIDLLNGQYEVNFIATETGRHIVCVTLYGEHVSESPSQFFVQDETVAKKISVKNQHSKKKPYKKLKHTSQTVFKSNRSTKGSDEQSPEFTLKSEISVTACGNATTQESNLCSPQRSLPKFAYKSRLQVTQTNTQRIDVSSSAPSNQPQTCSVDSGVQALSMQFRNNLKISETSVLELPNNQRVEDCNSGPATLEKMPVNEDRANTVLIKDCNLKAAESQESPKLSEQKPHDCNLKAAESRESPKVSEQKPELETRSTLDVNGNPTMNTACKAKENKFQGLDVDSKPSQRAKTSQKKEPGWTWKASNTKAKIVLKSDTAACLKLPIGICNLNNENFVVADTFHDSIKFLDREGKLLKAFGMKGSGPSQFTHPSAVVVFNDGTIAIKDNVQIQTFTADGDYIQSFGSNIFTKPYGLAIDSDERLITLNLAQVSTLCFFSKDGQLIEQRPFEPLFHYPVGSKCRFLAVHEDKVAVVDLGRSEVYVTNLLGQHMFTFGSFGQNPGFFYEPSGIAFDSSGNMIIADSKNDRIQVFSDTGDFLDILKLDQKIRRPSGIKLMPNGHLLVLNYLNHQLFVFKLQ